MQNDRIKLLRKKYPATSQRRRHIRSFVKSCAKTFMLENPILDVGSGYRSNEPEICFYNQMDFYTLDSNPGVKPTYVSDIMNMDIISSRSFGCVVCTEVLEHIESPNMALSEIYRILKPNGMLILTVPFWVPIHEKDHQPDYWRFTPRAVNLLLIDFLITEIKTQGNKERPTGIFVMAQKPSKPINKGFA